MVNSYHWKPFVLSGDGNRQLCQWRYPCSQNLLRNDPPFKVIKKFIVLEGVNLHNWQSAVTKVEWMIQLVVWQHGKGQGRDQEEGDFQVLIRIRISSSLFTIPNKLGDAIAISNLKLSITDWPTDPLTGVGAGRCYRNISRPPKGNVLILFTAMKGRGRQSSLANGVWPRSLITNL